MGKFPVIRHRHRLSLRTVERLEDTNSALVRPVKGDPSSNAAIEVNDSLHDIVSRFFGTGAIGKIVAGPFKPLLCFISSFKRGLIFCRFPRRRSEQRKAGRAMESGENEARPASTGPPNPTAIYDRQRVQVQAKQMRRLSLV